MEIERLENSPENFRRLKVEALSLRSGMDELESQLNDMRETFLNAAKLWPSFKLSPAETLIFSLLMSRSYATEAMMHMVLDWRRLDHRDGFSEIDRRLIRVFICKLRRRLKPFGIKIETVWGQGYRLTGEMKARVNEITQREVSE